MLLVGLVGFELFRFVDLFSFKGLSGSIAKLMPSSSIQRSLKCSN